MFRGKSSSKIALALSFVLASSFALGTATYATTTEKSVNQQLFSEESSQPIYNYEDSIKETVYVETALDSDRDGETDLIAADIIRPKETQESLRVPVIMDASPYYERLGRGNESEIKDPDGDGTNEKFPLFYDNYFIPRGYAIVQVDMVGTNHSEGCPTTGGYEETEGIKAVIDWLNGRTSARNNDGQEVVADWSTGKVGMIGKSYDGTLANGVAATGVEGLETIVPIAAISSWYDYYRYGGITFYNGGPSYLSRVVTARGSVEKCAPIREELAEGADDESGDYNSFWNERNFVKDAKNVKASVFVVHGLNDYNVKANHFSNWWEELSRYNVPRKLWLTQTGHVDPFDFRRKEWVNTLHRWFDYWLLDINNGIMDEPLVDIERAADAWETYSSWPDADSEPVKIRFRPGNEELPGALTTGPVQGNYSQSFTDDLDQGNDEMVEDEFTNKENRLIFLSPELTNNIRISGVPQMDISAKIDKENTNLTALIVDYGTDTRVDHRSRGEGIRTLDQENCWGQSSDVDDACYKITEKTTHEASYEIVTQGWLDAQNWKSLDSTDLLKPGKSYRFKWDALPEDYVFKPGHRIGIIIAGSDDRWTIPEENNAEIEISLGQSHMVLPVVGGKKSIEF
ncbi:Xaa-Pro dipeptidyl-peptidase [Pseudalkalibacillus salsuginis]|uniref:Xaa-Pro dipeptidyl-peptidase n=1 Tax=Pseudalkalibacillus salsuginis TaxID=2910972 RepID=UPI001F466284|nr:Xaa-Pro dipeptidyl-peptidase [Pseudalkalibacillus salsuginis]MCF6408808.1 Xaa-Pro dipeptidyl-peptidase [Pseudalkalibacillus salsuginis]